jgi:hypothetical protein
MKSKRFRITARVLVCSASLLVLAGSNLNLCAAQSKPKVVARSSPIFNFHDDEFWLNLHHFLYVLARAENKTRDSSRAAVSGAPADQQQGMALLTTEEQTVWKEAVLNYAAGPAKKDLVFDDPLPAVTLALAQARDTKSLKGVDPAIAAVLVRVAPIYRKAWWSKHQAANKAWRKETEGLVKRYGTSVLSFITKAYGMEWIARGYDVHLSAYCNWAGAYSTTSNLLVVSSLAEGNQGTMGLETVFHEGMHQWDDAVDAALKEQARRINKPVPDRLSHALIFFTAGAAVRHVVPEHTPYADKSGVWQRGMTREREVLTEIWKPYLEGRGTRDEALAALIKQLSERNQGASPV